MTLILLNKREWFGYWMSWLAKRHIRWDYFLLIGKRKKWFFSKLTRTPHCKERFLHHKVLKEKFRSFSNSLLNKFILKSPCRLDQRSLSSPWLTKCLPTNSWTTFGPDPPKRGTQAVYQRLGPNHLHDLRIGLTPELRLDLILLKEVRRQSIKDSVPIICMTFK